MKQSSIIMSLIGLSSAVNTEWPLYNALTGGASIPVSSTFGAGGGYSCLRAGYTWIPQVSVTGTDSAKTAGQVDGLRWYRT